MLKVVPANPKLLVEPMGVEVKSKGGLFLPGKVFGEDLQLARVLSVSHVVSENGNPNTQKGKIVLMNRHAGFEIVYESQVMKLITENDIHAYVEIDGEEADVLVPQTTLPGDYDVTDPNEI